MAGVFYHGQDVLATHILSSLAQEDVMALEVATRGNVDLRTQLLVALQNVRLSAKSQLNQATSTWFQQFGCFSTNICLPWNARMSEEDQAIQTYLSLHAANATELHLERCNGLSEENITAIIEAFDVGEGSSLSTLAITGCNQHPKEIFMPLIRPGLKRFHLVEDSCFSKEWLTTALQSTGNLREIELTAVANLSDNFLIRLAQLSPLLTSLIITHGSISDDSTNALAELCPGLEVLKLYDCQRVTNKGVTAFSRQGSPMHTVHIDSADQQLQLADLVCVARHMHLLKHFCVGLADLSNVRIADRQRQWRQAFNTLAVNCPFIRTLSLNWSVLCFLVGDGTDARPDILSRFAVEELVVQGLYRRMGDGAFQGFATRFARQVVRTLKRLTIWVPETQGDLFVTALVEVIEASHVAVGQAPLLEALNLSGCDSLTDAALSRLIQACPRLSSLRLDGAVCLTDALLQTLAHHGRGQGGRLRSLVLPQSSLMTDVGLCELTHRCPQLTHLDLSAACQLTDRSVHALAAHCLHLQCLSLASSAQLSYYALRRLCLRCPRLQELDIHRRCLPTAHSAEQLEALHPLTRLVVTVTGT